MKEVVSSGLACFFMGLLFGAWGYMAVSSTSDCQIVIKADGTKTAAEVVEEFQKITAGTTRG